MADDINIKISPDLEDIKVNAAKLRALRKEAENTVKIIDAWIRANQSICEHPGRTGWSDPRGDDGWNACPHCGSTQ